MTPKDPFLEGTFWDECWRPIRSRALLFTPESWGTLTEIKFQSSYCPGLVRQPKIVTDMETIFELSWAALTEISCYQIIFGVW